MIELHLVRHGIRFDSENPSWRKTAKRPKDTPLSERGIKQAKEVGEYLKGKNITHIISSPYYRTLETSQHIAETLDTSPKIIIEEGVREWVKVQLAQPVYISRKEAVEIFPSLDHEYKSTFDCPTKIETPEEIRERCNQFVSYLTHFLKELLENSSNSKVSVVVISHAATLISLINALNKKADLSLQVGTATISTFHLEDSNWVMKSCAESSHLSEGLQFPWGFEDS